VVKINGIPKTVTEEALELYLENKRKSGGGKVKTIDYNSTAGFATVLFEDDTG
jgi:hypothetical protein